eukprot:Skav225415  [mRNA]  locus=scaffold2656:783903:784904:- [translate_table: standard]
MDPYVDSRMTEICGGTSYSVTLRNSEHVARYIQTGSWISWQMDGDSKLAKTFKDHLTDEARKKLNRLPTDLWPYTSKKPLYHRQEYPGFLQYSGSPEGLSKEDEKAFNVLLFGPAGCGKSRLINLLFNLTVAESRGAAFSVTRDISIYAGNGLVNGQQRKVNIIDTIGLCDTHIPDDKVLDLIKDRLKVNFAYLDQVVVICAGRVERHHADGIGRILDWLRYNQYFANFTFVYNKKDQMQPHERAIAGNQAWQILNIGPHYVQCQRNGDRVRARPLGAGQGGNQLIPKCIVTGFPTGPFINLSNDLGQFVDSVFADPAGSKRIPVDESWCSIL